MQEALRRAGWANYSIFLQPDGTLFGYVEVPDSLAEATARTVYLGTMPPSGGIQPAAEDVLYRWSLCGAPP